MMEVLLKITKNDKPVLGISAYIIDGEHSWPEVAGVSDEKGEIALPVSASGSFTVRIQSEDGPLDVECTTGQKRLVSL